MLLADKFAVCIEGHQIDDKSLGNLAFASAYG